MKNKWVAALFCCTLMLIHPLAQAVDVSQPDRDFGYVIGDVLEQTITLAMDGETLILETQPETGRVGLWFERQSVALDPDTHQLQVRYQLINSPTDIISTTLPALALEFANHAPIEIPAWPVSINPLTADSNTEDSTLPLQADKRAGLQSMSALGQKTWRWAAALGLVLAAWLGLFAWWRHQDTTTLPFAGAYRLLSRGRRNKQEDDITRWQYVHRAFNATAGKTVHAGGLQELVAQHDWLMPLQADITAFFQSSAARFFSPDADVSGDFDLVRFCQQLRTAEQRHINQR